jgi:hypothetical protein
MSELRRDGRQLLAEARHERTPDAATREQVFSALMANEALSQALAAAEDEPKPLTGWGKWLLLAALVVVVALGVYAAGHVGAKSSVTAPPPTLR